jgi:hypothetical protein
MTKSAKKSLGARQTEALIDMLRDRFEQNRDRHKAIPWTEVDSRLESEPDKLWALAEMERTGGEPDVVGQDKKTGEIFYVDCSPESPAGRRSLCYDREALDSRKKNKPEGSAVEMAAAWGATLLSEAEYRHLQELGPVDQKTSSWLLSPPEVRDLGGAIFGDYRFGRVFIYHNGAESYYAARGFRCVLRV